MDRGILLGTKAMGQGKLCFSDHVCASNLNIGLRRSKFNDVYAFNSRIFIWLSNQGISNKKATKCLRDIAG